MPVYVLAAGTHGVNMKAKLLTGEQGMPLTKAMFFETSLPASRTKYCSFTLKDVEHKGYPSLKQIYMSFDDPTEYDFAIAAFGSFQHWKILQGCKWLQPYIEAWREEQEVRLRSEAIKQIAIHALGEKGYSASKWIAEAQWKPKQIGGPTKKQIDAKNRVSNLIDKSVSSDLSRLQSVSSGRT